MSRRSTPQRKIDEAAFPVRLKVKVPEMGFGRVLDEIHVWLRENVGRNKSAHHGGGRGLSGDDQATFYFTTTADAHAFMQAFPQLELDDGTQSPAYSAPSFVDRRGNL